MTYNNMVDWMNAYCDEAKAANDQQKLRLCQLASRIINAYSNNAHQAFPLIDEALTLAANLNEPCWTVIYHSMRVQTYLYRLIDLPTSVRIASEAIVALRKPEYQNCPSYEDLYTSLITAYMYIDPYGYATKIIETLDFIEQNFDLDTSSQCDIKLRRLTVMLALEDYESARQLGLEALNINSNNMGVYLFLAFTAFCQHDAHLALEYIQQAELCPRSPGIKGDIDLVQLLGYQAAFLLKLGQVEAADDVKNRAYLLIDKIQSEPFFSFYEAIAWYYEEKGELEQAIRTSRKLIEESERHGSIYGGCAGRVFWCRLIGKASQPLEAALAETRESFKRLIDPSLLLKKVERIENGDYSFP